MTDNWAKELGASSLEDLKNKIKENLEAEKKFQEEQRLEMELLEKVVKQVEISEIPENLIQSEAHRMIHEFEDSIIGQGLNFDDYLKNIKKERHDLEKEFRPKAEDRVKTSIVIKEIADSEKVGAGDKEIEEETEKILRQVKGNRGAEDNIRSEGYKGYLKTIIRNRKVIEMLKQECLK